MKTTRTILDRLVDDGAVCSHGFTDTELVELQELESQGMALQVSKIPSCHPRTLNPEYVYVTNDAAGRKLATDRSLFTR